MKNLKRIDRYLNHVIINKIIIEPFSEEIGGVCCMNGYCGFDDNVVELRTLIRGQYMIQMNEAIMFFRTPVMESNIFELEDRRL